VGLKAQLRNGADYTIGLVSEAPSVTRQNPGLVGTTLAMAGDQDRVGRANVAAKLDTTRIAAGCRCRIGHVWLRCTATLRDAKALWIGDTVRNLPRSTCGAHLFQITNLLRSRLPRQSSFPQFSLPKPIGFDVLWIGQRGHTSPDHNTNCVNHFPSTQASISC